MNITQANGEEIIWCGAQVIAADRFGLIGKQVMDAGIDHRLELALAGFRNANALVMLIGHLGDGGGQIALDPAGNHLGGKAAVGMAAEQMIGLLRGEYPPRILNPDVWPAYSRRFKDILGTEPAAAPFSIPDATPNPSASGNATIPAVTPPKRSPRRFPKSP